MSYHAQYLSALKWYASGYQFQNPYSDLFIYEYIYSCGFVTTLDMW